MCAEADWTPVPPAPDRRRARQRAAAGSCTSAPTAPSAEHELTESAVVEDGRITYPEPQTSLDV